MYKISKLNKISQTGLNVLSDKYSITESIEEAHGILVRSQDMHEMDFSERLLAVARAGAGVNNIPLDKCADKGIVVFNTPGANANAVKELVVCAMLLEARNIPGALVWAKGLTEDVAKTVEKGKSQFAGNEIKGKTLGVIGLGAIGAMVANSAGDLGMKVIGFDPYLTVKSAHLLSRDVKVVDSLKDILPECDFISIHVPAMDSTKGMIDGKCFEMMKDGATILNFSRDKIVDEKKLVDVIKAGRNIKYVTDFPNETVINCEGITLLPHLGASTEESEDNCAKMAVEEIMDYIENGNITNSVNFPPVNMGAKTAESRIAVLHKNDTGIVADITAAIDKLGAKAVNMMSNSKGERAYTLIDTDKKLEIADVEANLKTGIIKVRVI